MVIGILQLDLAIPGADSLKAKRMALRSLRDRVRQNFNVSIAEVDENDQWQTAAVAVVVVANDKRFANQVLSRVVEFAEKHYDVVVDDYTISFL